MRIFDIPNCRTESFRASKEHTLCLILSLRVLPFAQLVSHDTAV